MNLPTLIVLLLIAALLTLALWLNRRSGRKLTDCGSCSAYAKFCFKCLNELSKLQDGHRLNVCDQLFFIHCFCPFLYLCLKYDF